MHDSTVCYENCFIELQTSNRNIIPCSLYGPLNQNLKGFVQYVDSLLTKITKEKSKELILGLDHNLDLLKHHMHKNTQVFMEKIVDSCLIPTITRPTRITKTSATLIDNIIMSMNIAVKQTSCVLLSDITDHFPYLSVIKNCLPDRSNESTTSKRKLTEKNISHLKEKLSLVNWSELLPCGDVNSSTLAFHSKLLEILDSKVPEKVMPVSTHKVINMLWMTSGILRCSTKQLRLYKKLLMYSH